MLNQSAALDLRFQALADPTRRAMVLKLVKGPATVSDLAEPLEMSLPAVMQHLKLLESSGLVRSKKVGRVRTCSLEPKALQTTEQFFSGLRELWEQRLDRLAEYLEKEQRKDLSK